MTAATVVASVGGLFFGYLAGIPVAPPPVYAACGAAYNCTLDNTATSSLTVNHTMTNGAGGAPVEPDDGETWTVVATWSSDTGMPLGCSCIDLGSATATVDVQWSESTDSWSATCTAGCSATMGPIRGVSICDGSECGGGDNGWSYELIVDIDHSLYLNCPVSGSKWGYLSKVAYTTTAVDDGNEIDISDCSEGAVVSPGGTPYSATDTGAFECAFTCAASGPTVTINYQ
jgi:hypothetical protein